MDINQFYKAEQNYQYIASMRPVFNRKALFSDTTENFISPAEPSAYDELTIRFRCARNNIDRVFFVNKGEKHIMLKTESDEYFDYYSHKEQLENEKLSYYFEIQAGKINCFYDMRGVVKDVDPHYHFQVIPGFKTPSWAKGAVFYQIYIDRFYNGDTSNDVLTNEYCYIDDGSVKVDDWNKYPAAMGVREFYGGDLQGVLDKMDYLQDLGIDVIYFNPLFVSPSNHKYDIQDYDNIDPHIGRIVNDEGDLLQPGQRENRFASKYINRIANKENLEASNALFAEVVSEAHKRGIKVILDGVFNHCGSFNKWMDRERIYEDVEGYEKGAYVSKESPYHNYFQFQSDKWPYNGAYDGWWGYNTLPKLNYEDSKELFDYVLKVAQKWVSPPYNVDGWRLDVAADLGHSPEFNHHFWKEFRKAVKTANPEAIILAEHYGNPKDWLQGDQWDTIMNYDAFMEPVTWFLTGMQKHSDDYREDLRGNAGSFWESMRYHGACYTMPSLQTSMNELSNHDHSRFLTRTNRRVGRVNTLGPEAANDGINKAVLKEAVVIQMTWPGAPTIYYGDEVGVCGFTDPDNRRSYPWGREDKELLEFHKEIIRIHKQNKEFLTGSLKYMEEDYNVIGYGRFTKDKQSAILINNNDYEITKTLSIWYLGTPKECILKRLMLTTADGFTTEPEEYTVSAGKVSITLPPTSAIILQHTNDKGVSKKFIGFE
ncbi:MAG: glycoside hydrolase family 13 protein [Lachnospiraceae bacterium]|nr:glycoside hydrolase family 13 protein [Lachnospiraceae bacterium]